MQRSVLLFSLALFLFFCVGFSAWSVVTDRERTIMREIARVEVTANLLGEHSARALEASDALLMRMGDMVAAWDLVNKAVGHSIRAKIVHHIGTSGPVGSAWVLDDSGELLLENWGYPPDKVNNFSFRDYFSHHLVSDVPLFIGGGAIGTTTDKPRFTLSRAVRDDDGALKAVVVAGVFAGHWVTVFDAITPGPALAALVRSDGVPMVASSGADPETLAALLAAMDREGIVKLGDKGSYLIAKRPIGDYPATMLLAIPLEESLAPWRMRAVSITAVGIIASIIFLCVILLGLGAVRREEDYKRELEAKVAVRTGELARALDAAHSAARAKDVFLSTVSHDLRQPLQAMSLLTAVVADSAQDDRTRKLADQIGTSLTYGQRLLNDLVDLAQLDAGVVRVEPSEVDLRELFDALRAETLEIAEAAEIDLRVVVPSLRIFSDLDRLRQILQNLVSNAIKNTKPGGKVLLGCRHSHGAVRIEVWDTGSGIPADKIDAVFEQFYQIGNSARNSAHGVGLGLAIVRRIADLLGHDIKVCSQPGKGSVFSVSVRLMVAP